MKDKDYDAAVAWVMVVSMTLLGLAAIALIAMVVASG